MMPELQTVGRRAMEAFPRLVASSPRILVSISRVQIDHSALPAQLPLEGGMARFSQNLPDLVALVTANDISPSAGSSIS